MSNQAYLDNTMLGETVIYCDDNGAKYAAMIVRAISDEVVDLLPFSAGLKTVASAVPFNHKVESVPGTWWRRNKM